MRPPAFRPARAVAVAASAMAVAVVGPGVASAASVHLAADPIVVTQWGGVGADTRKVVSATVTIGGKPVSGLHVRAGGYRVPAATDADGVLHLRIDPSVVRRTTLRADGLSGVRVDGKRPDSAERAALRHWRGGIVVGFEAAGLQVRRTGDEVTITGTLRGNDVTPLPVVLYAYRLRGTVSAPGSDAGYTVTSLDAEREYWNLSAPTGSDGRFSSFFLPRTGNSDFSVEAYRGAKAWTMGFGNRVHFPALQSARVHLHLESGGMLKADTPVAEPGAIYEGLFVGVARHGKVVRPTAATWPGRDGRFSLTYRARDLDGSGRLSLWQSQRYAYSKGAATPGGTLDLGAYPHKLTSTDPRGLATVDVPAAAAD